MTIRARYTRGHQWRALLYYLSFWKYPFYYLPKNHKFLKYKQFIDEERLCHKKILTNLWKKLHFDPNSIIFFKCPFSERKHSFSAFTDFTVRHWSSPMLFTIKSNALCFIHIHNSSAPELLHFIRNDITWAILNIFHRVFHTITNQTDRLSILFNRFAVIRKAHSMRRCTDVLQRPVPVPVPVPVHPVLSIDLF